LANNPKPRNIRNIRPTKNSGAVVVPIINRCPLLCWDVENSAYLADDTSAIVAGSLEV
jgi:hypothetical protein